MKYFVEIYERKTGHVEERMEAYDEHDANRIKQGASINLNRMDYAVRIVTDER